MLGKIEGRRRVQQRMRWLDGITDSMDMGLGRWTGRPGVLRFMGLQKVRHDWATELNWTELNESALHIRWPNYWSFSVSISPSGEYSGLISIEIDWFDFLEVQGTFRSLLQDHSSKASILWHSAFFMVQFSQLYVTTGKTIPSTIQTFVGRVMSLLFNILSTFVITLLSRSKRLLISWLQSPSVVILEPKKRNLLGS